MLLAAELVVEVVVVGVGSVLEVVGPEVEGPGWVGVA